MNNIPKILHQSAPKNKKIWHPIWNKCQKSWLKNFKNFKYVMWTDEKIDNFLKKNFSEYYNLLNSSPLHIIKLDIVRYMILYKFGGIYADMDIYCYKNFFKNFNENIYLTESSSNNEIVQNSFMITKKNHPFFKKCIDTSIYRLKNINLNKLIYDFKKTNNKLKLDNAIFYIGGPILLSSLYKKYYKKYKISLLSNLFYNVHSSNYSKNIKTKHMLTGFWGKDTINELRQIKNKLNLNITEQQFFLINFLQHRNINAKTYKF